MVKDLGFSKIAGCLYFGKSDAKLCDSRVMLKHEFRPGARSKPKFQICVMQFKLHITIIGHKMTQKTTANIPAELGDTD